MTDFAQRVAKKLMERGYLAHWPFPTSIVTVVAQVIRRLLSEHASHDTLAREIRRMINEQVEVAKTSKDRMPAEIAEGITRFGRDVLNLLAPYFAARDERDAEVRRKVTMLRDYLRSQRAPRTLSDLLDQALALLQKEASDED